MRRISRVVEELVASQERLCSMELVHLLPQDENVKPVKTEEQRTPEKYIYSTGGQYQTP